MHDRYGCKKYEQPRVERFGTLRDLTRADGIPFWNLFTPDASDGCAMDSSSSYTCIK